jgi:hypothetical protein
LTSRMGRLIHPRPFRGEPNCSSSRSAPQTRLPGSVSHEAAYRKQRARRDSCKQPRLEKRRVYGFLYHDIVSDRKRREPLKVYVEIPWKPELTCHALKQGEPPRDDSGSSSEDRLMRQLVAARYKACRSGRGDWQCILASSTPCTLVNAPRPVKIAQQQLEHASVETTLKMYTYVIPETHWKAVESLERVLFSNAPILDHAPVC